ncbi:WD40-repeat-containing domain protein [Kickxella alabastrina]|uniref:WD40-repeat-containing domain protein n=1 Tax=Kickxella alabastrina TaxID=61397 RepID=UPI00221FDCC1|nr:WD40-repeat-containing domain protein [Kickxella alabastrina]KAI7823921.1 WD40-repeat-containing domain protein [Kickxella alabastrina]
MRGSSLAQQRIADLEREVEALKEERTVLYRSQGTNAQRLLDLSDQMRENDDRMRQQELEISDSHEALRRTNSKINDMQDTLKEKDGTIQILQDEMSALQLEIVQIEERCGRLQAENDDLVRRWLKKMNDEAEKVNDVTHELELIKRKSAALSPRLGMAAVFEDDHYFGLSPISVRHGGSVAPRSAVGKIDARMEELHSIALTSNGELLAVGGQSSTVKVFEAATGDSVYSLTGCLKGVNHVEISSDNSMLLAASSDHTARIWKLDTGRHWKSLTGHIGSVVTAKFNIDGSRVFTYSQDRTVKVWDTQRGLCIKTLFTVSSCHDIAILDSEGHRLVTAHMDNSIRIWDTVSGKKLQEAAIHKEQVMSVWANRTGTRVLTNSCDGTLKFVDTATMDVLTVMSASGYRPSRNWARASLSPDERYAMAGSIDGKLYVWDVNSGDLVRSLDIHKSAVCDSLWDPTGARVYSAEKGRYIMMLQ